MNHWQTLILDEWYYVPITLLAGLWAFGIGLLIGWLITVL
jgi:hypothetical protein